MCSVFCTYYRLYGSSNYYYYFHNNNNNNNNNNNSEISFRERINDDVISKCWQVY